MPVCKNCYSRIDKFNKERCPICGVINPFEGMVSDTIEITTYLDVDRKDYHPRKRVTELLLHIFLGWIGVNWYYTYKYKKGLIALAITLVLVGLGGFFLGYFIPSIGYKFSFLIIFLIIFIVHLIYAVVAYTIPNRKDGRGDFLI